MFKNIKKYFFTWKVYERTSNNVVYPYVQFVSLSWLNYFFQHSVCTFTHTQKTGNLFTSLEESSRSPYVTPFIKLLNGTSFIQFSRFFYKTLYTESKSEFFIFSVVGQMWLPYICFKDFFYETIFLTCHGTKTPGKQPSPLPHVFVKQQKGKGEKNYYYYKLNPIILDMNVVLHINLLHAAFIIIIIYVEYTKKFHNSYKYTCSCTLFANDSTWKANKRIRHKKIFLWEMVVLFF